MLFYFIVFAELLRGFSCRSMTLSVMQLETNKHMWFAVGASVVISLLVGNVPGLMDVFELEYLTGEEWGAVIGLSVIPFIADELYKAVVRTVSL